MYFYFLDFQDIYNVFHFYQTLYTQETKPTKFMMRVPQRKIIQPKKIQTLSCTLDFRKHSIGFSIRKFFFLIWCSSRSSPSFWGRETIINWVTFIGLMYFSLLGYVIVFVRPHPYQTRILDHLYTKLTKDKKKFDESWKSGGYGFHLLGCVSRFIIRQTMLGDLSVSAYKKETIELSNLYHII